MTSRDAKHWAKTTRLGHSNHHERTPRAPQPKYREIGPFWVQYEGQEKLFEIWDVLKAWWWLMLAPSIVFMVAACSVINWTR